MILRSILYVSSDNTWVYIIEYHVVECYCTCIIEILRYFFILQSLTTSKMRKFQTLKLSQFQKAKTCCTENWWSSGIMSNFWGEFFLCFGGQKKFWKFFKKYLSVRTKKLHKIKLKNFFFDTWKKNMNFKHELSPSKPLLRSTLSLILGEKHFETCVQCACMHFLQ